MRFFSALDGSLYPVDEIRRIGRPREVEFQPTGRKNTVYTVYLPEDETAEITQFELESIQQSPTHMFAALPGTYILHYEEEDQSHFSTAVIGWASSAEGMFYPVTAEGINDGTPRTSHAVLLHDGSVVIPMDQSFRSLGEWKEAMIGRQAERRKANA